MVGDLGKGVEPIDGRNNFASLMGSEGFGVSSNRFAVSDPEDFVSR